MAEAPHRTNEEGREYSVQLWDVMLYQVVSYSRGGRYWIHRHHLIKHFIYLYYYINKTEELFSSDLFSKFKNEKPPPNAFIVLLHAGSSVGNPARSTLVPCSD